MQDYPNEISAYICLNLKITFLYQNITLLKLPGILEPYRDLITSVTQEILDENKIQRLSTDILNSTNPTNHPYSHEGSHKVIKDRIQRKLKLQQTTPKDFNVFNADYFSNILTFPLVQLPLMQSPPLFSSIEDLSSSSLDKLLFYSSEKLKRFHFVPTSLML